MIASSDHKGEKPSGYIAVQVTFDTGFNTDKLGCTFMWVKALP